MAQQPSQGARQVQRVYEQHPDAISLYSDFVQIMGTGNEIIMQFYETIPGTPGPGGQIAMVRTRLRATITVSIPHATKMGNLLLQRIQAGSIISGIEEGGTT